MPPNARQNKQSAQKWPYFAPFTGERKWRKGVGIYIYVLCLSSFSEIQQNVKDNSGPRRRGGGVLGGESMGSEQAGYCTRTFSYIVLIILKKQLKQISKHSKILPKLGIFRPILGIEIQLVCFFHYIRLRLNLCNEPGYNIVTNTVVPKQPNA